MTVFLGFFILMYTLVGADVICRARTEWSKVLMWTIYVLGLLTLCTLCIMTSEANPWK